MLPYFIQVKKFLSKTCSSGQPLLLALSGGPDSLYLFYALLHFRHEKAVEFHVAHVNHGWRKESREEAEMLQRLTAEHQVPFHLKVLDSSSLKGNLEAACRKERYAFFGELARENHYQAVLTGHHQDDLAETVFKRLLEGAHWSRWATLRADCRINGYRVLRPLMNMKKKDIQRELQQHDIEAFHDPTNHDSKFLRARFRETIFPYLNQVFGKEIQKNLSLISGEALELVEFFEERLAPILARIIRGPFGIYLDLQNCLPSHSLEVKYLLRLLGHQEGFFLSREIIDQAALALQLGKANQSFIMGSHRIWIDRRYIFILFSTVIAPKNESIKISPGSGSLGNWKYAIIEELAPQNGAISSWREGWQGYLKSYLPIGNYFLGFNSAFQSAVIKKHWNQMKVPAFLYSYFPLLWNENDVFHEFLSGKSLYPVKQGEPCWAIELTYYKKREKNDLLVM